MPIEKLKHSTRQAISLNKVLMVLVMIYFYEINLINHFKLKRLMIYSISSCTSPSRLIRMRRYHKLQYHFPLPFQAFHLSAVHSPVCHFAARTTSALSRLSPPLYDIYHTGSNHY